MTKCHIEQINEIIDNQGTQQLHKLLVTRRISEQSFTASQELRRSNRINPKNRCNRVTFNRLSAEKISICTKCPPGVPIVSLFEGTNDARRRSSPGTSRKLWQSYKFRWVDSAGRTQPRKLARTRGTCRETQIGTIIEIVADLWNIVYKIGDARGETSRNSNFVVLFRFSFFSIYSQEGRISGIIVWVTELC